MLSTNWTHELISLEQLVGIVRIAFGLMLFIKLYWSIKAHHLVWAHRVPNGSRSFLYILLTGLVLANICFILGVFTGPAALLQWALYVFLFRFASLYGLEDVSFHTICFYFVFAGAGGFISVDNWMGIELWGRIPANTLIPELALATALGNIFFSAGITKLPSKMWRNGLGAYYFFLLPNFRRLDTAPITSRPKLIRFANHMALVMELGVLPAFLINSVPLGLLFWGMGIGFTISLATVFVLTWIGEAMTVGMCIVLWLLLHANSQGLAMFWIEEFSLLADPFGLFVGCVLLITLVSGFITALIAEAKWLGEISILTNLYKIFRYIARYTWGLIPCEVFTEVHMKGSIVYRVYARAEADPNDREVFKIYSPSCGPGPERLMRPTFYEVTAYKVAETCMELDLYGEVNTPERQQFILQLSQYIVKNAGKSLPNTPDSLIFKIVQLVPPEQFAGATTSWYIDMPWVEAFAVDLVQGKPHRIRPLAKPALTAPTGRDLERKSFDFIPLSS